MTMTANRPRRKPCRRVPHGTESGRSSRATHQSVWSYPLSGKPALSPNGILYIQNATDLVAVNLK